MSEQWFEREPLWFKRAVFYEIHIRGFFDGNDDGSGDFRGLIEKLDFLQWLGVDCLWLLPMYQSPLRDGGYDIADFFAIHPDYGTVEDFREFVDQAHQRGMRVIADLVMNHTSSDHPWFQESRTDPTGPRGDWYVWSDTDEPYSEARIIFLDTEASNWTFDPVRGQYYWHRFFHHQPDLNYDNAEVQEAMLNVLRFWLDLGIDGFRLDAVPYLYEREGSNGENLPKTHEYLRRVRAEIDARYSRTACSSPRRTSGPRTSSSTSATATSATWRSTSPSCRACSCRCGARTRRRCTRSSTARRRSPTTRSGGSSSATTTS
jgi:Glycosidases